MEALQWKKKSIMRTLLEKRVVLNIRKFFFVKSLNYYNNYKFFKITKILNFLFWNYELSLTNPPTLNNPVRPDSKTIMISSRINSYDRFSFSFCLINSESKFFIFSCKSKIIFSLNLNFSVISSVKFNIISRRPQWDI